MLLVNGGRRKETRLAGIGEVRDMKWGYEMGGRWKEDWQFSCAFDDQSE